MTGLITKLAAKTLESSNLLEVKSFARKLNNELKVGLMNFTQDLTNSKSNNTLEKELEKALLESINYDNLEEVEKAVAELSIFSIKFQIKKLSYENSIPLRVELTKYTDLETNNALVDLQKYQWMQEEFKSYVRNDLLYKLDYMEVITTQGAHLNDTQKRVLIFGPSFREDGF
jgi:transcriptional regulator with AAA-type ATPase domain